MCVDLSVYIFCGLKRSVLTVYSSVEVAVLELFVEERERFNPAGMWPLGEYLDNFWVACYLRIPVLDSSGIAKGWVQKILG